MSYSPTGSYPTGLTSPTDKRIGDAFPIIEEVYKHLPHLKYLAENANSLVAKQIELRGNTSLQSIEWAYQDTDEWFTLIAFTDLTGGIAIDDLINNLSQLLNDAKTYINDQINQSQALASQTQIWAQYAADNINRIGYDAPVAYSAGLVVNHHTFTVDYNGVLYSPLPSKIPFTTGAWDPSKWTLVQNLLNQKNLLVFDTYVEASAAAATLPDGQVVVSEYDEVRGVVNAGSIAQEQSIYAVADYAKINNYAGRAARLRVYDPTGAHWWVRRGTAADNGGTVLKDALNRSWVREFSGAANIKWFMVDGAVSDDFSMVRAIVAGNGAVKIPAGVTVNITASMTQPAMPTTIIGEGVTSKIECRAPIFKSEDVEKSYKLTIQDVNLHSIDSFAIHYSYPFQSGNQENSVHCINVLFTGANGVSFTNVAGIRFTDCQWRNMTGTAIYARLVVNMDTFGGVVSSCAVPFYIDGDHDWVEGTCGIKFIGTRFIGCTGGGLIRNVDQPALIDVLYDYCGTLGLSNNIGGNITGYFGSKSEYIITNSAGLIPTKITARLTHYDAQNGKSIAIQGPTILDGCTFQNAVHHVVIQGSNVKINNCYFQKDGNGRSIERSGDVYTALISNNMFESAGEAFPSSVSGMIFSSNVGTELSDMGVILQVPGGLNYGSVPISKKKAPKSAICNTPGFYVTHTTSDVVFVLTADGSPVSTATDVLVSLVF